MADNFFTTINLWSCAMSFNAALFPPRNEEMSGPIDCHIQYTTYLYVFSINMMIKFAALGIVFCLYVRR